MLLLKIMLICLHQAATYYRFLKGGILMEVRLWKDSVDSFPFSFANRKWIRSQERIVSQV